MNPSRAEARPKGGTLPARPPEPFGAARTRRSYALQWTLILGAAAAFAAWSLAGHAWVRRRLLAPAAVPAAARGERGFLAVLLPRVRPSGGRSALSRRDLGRLLDGLARRGYATVSLADVERLYTGGGLPPRAVVLLFGDDAPGLAAADRELERRRMRAAAFVSRAAASGGVAERRFLTRHALGQMRDGGAWDFGLVRGASPTEPELARARALLEDAPAAGAAAAEGRPAPPADAGRWTLRFVPSELGYNDGRSDPRSLRALALRPDRPVEEDLKAIDGSWPREQPFADDFAGPGLGPDWIPGWGVAAAGGRRLALLPAPRQTGAGVFLRGTETWRDSIVEFELRKYRKEFWAYARYDAEGRFVRVGARDGFWFVEQKSSPRAQPTVLARAPIASLPARVRVVLKGGSLLLHVDGRMQFGRAVRLHPAVAEGRVLLGVYDARLRSSLAVLGSVRASPVPSRWLAFRDGGASVETQASRLDRLREEAVLAQAITPRWLTLSSDGRVAVSRENLPLLQSLAGFYSCRLLPMGDLPSSAALLAAGPAALDRLAAALAEAAEGLGAPGVNLRLKADEAAAPEAVRLLARLRRGLNARKRELWVTVDGGAPPPALARAADGVLVESRRGSPFETLELAQISKGGTAQLP